MLTTFSGYHLALEKWSKKNGKPMPLDIAYMGLVGETGEVCDLLKKVLWHGKPLDRQHLLEELGDVLWYADKIAELQHTTLGYLLLEQDDFAALESMTLARVHQIIGLKRLATNAGVVACDPSDWDYAFTPEKRLHALRKVVVEIMRLAHYHGFTLADVAQANVDKLERRYPGGFVEGGGIR